MSAAISVIFRSLFLLILELCATGINISHGEEFTVASVPVETDGSIQPTVSMNEEKYILVTNSTQTM